MTSQEYNQEIYDTVISSGYSDTLARLMVAQAQYETGNYTNNAFLLHNNAFGYKYVKGGMYQLPAEGNTSSEGDSYASYASVQDSAKEVLAWLQRRQNEGIFQIADLTTPELYAAALKAADYYGQSAGDYASGLNIYISKLAFMYYNNKKTVNYAVIGGVLIGITAYIYYLKKRNVA